MFEVFTTRSIWLELGIPKETLSTQIASIFGYTNETLDYEKGIECLGVAVNKLQHELIERFKKSERDDELGKLLTVHHHIYQFYEHEKRTRAKLIKYDTGQNVFDTFLTNRNICRNIIDATNLWIENALLLAPKVTDEPETYYIELDTSLVITMFLYGAASQSLTLLKLTPPIFNHKKYHGLRIDVENEIPIQAIKTNPTLYDSPLLSGNQTYLVKSKEVLSESSTVAMAFQEVYGVTLLEFLGILLYTKDDPSILDNCPFYTLNAVDFATYVSEVTAHSVDSQRFIKSFVLDSAKVESQLGENEPIIWRMNTNYYRFEIRPFLQIGQTVYISKTAMAQSLEAWMGFLSGGNSCYSNVTDRICEAIEIYSQLLSKRLVEWLKSELTSRYKNCFIDTEVQYDEIFGRREIDYGDFDIVFYAKDTNELFLIEAKYFSDSLSGSAHVNDYKKLFKVDGYYGRCRRRYELVINDSVAMKSFIMAGDIPIKAHFLFVSSKPLEIDFQDPDGIVTFLSMRNFGRYLEGKLESTDGKEIMRPFIEI